MTEQEAMEVIMQVAYDGEFPMNSNEAFGIACKCIEKQMPKKMRDDGYHHIICNCEHKIPMYMRYEIAYCPYCGQALKWE